MTGAELVVVAVSVRGAADPLLVEDNCDEVVAGAGAKLNEVDAGGAEVTAAAGAGAFAPNERGALMAGATAAGADVVVIVAGAAGNENPVRDGATEAVGADVTVGTEDAAAAGGAVGAGNSVDDDATADIPAAGVAAEPNENAGVVNDVVVVENVEAGVVCGKLKPDPVLDVVPNPVVG